MPGDIPLSTVSRGGMYDIPSDIISSFFLNLSPYRTVLVLSNLARRTGRADYDFFSIRPHDPFVGK